MHAPAALAALACVATASAAATGTGTIYVLPTGGRMGNQLSTYAACYALALRTNLSFSAPSDVGGTRSPHGACELFPQLPGCGAEAPADIAAVATPLPAEKSWWDGNVKATIAAIATAPGGPFLCTGYRQSASYFANDDGLTARVRAAPTTVAGHPVDEAAFVRALRPTRHELAPQPAAADEGDWGQSHMSRVGIRFSFAGMRTATRLADAHAAAHGAYDVYVRARYDMYRLREGTAVPERVATCCFHDVQKRTLYWFDSSPGGVVAGVPSRGGGDNLFWGAPDAVRDVVARIDATFDVTTAACFKTYGDKHPENLLQQAARDLAVTLAGCGRDDGFGTCAAPLGATPPPAAAAAATAAAAPARLHFVNFAHGAIPR